MLQVVSLGLIRSAWQAFLQLVLSWNRDKYEKMSITNQVLAFLAYCYRGWLDSWILLESCLTSDKPDLDSCGLPDMASVGKELFSWPGCFRLWVRLWPLSVWTFHLSILSSFSLAFLWFLLCVCVCVCVCLFVCFKSKTTVNPSTLLFYPRLFWRVLEQPFSRVYRSEEFWVPH